MNKFTLIQALRLSMLESRINEFAEMNEILSVSIFQHQNAILAAVTYKQPETDVAPVSIKIATGHLLKFNEIRVISEADGIRALTKDRKYCVGGTGDKSMYHTVNQAIDALVKCIEDDLGVNVILEGVITEVDGYNGC